MFAPLTESILYTDFYQFTMAQVYYRLGIHERPALFDHFFREYPDYGSHQAGFAVNAGLEPFIEWMRQARVEPEHIELLRGLKGRTGKPLFDADFLDWLSRHGNFEALTIRAVPEGRVVHPNTPLTVVEGPLAMAQILETALLNQLNYATLIATKAARVRYSAQSSLVLEFGLRRAHDRGGHAGARAALIGGADFTSNVAMSFALGLPPKGTHAHSMVQVAMALGMGELGAFEAYADMYPDDCILLVDTIDTLESGIPNAIKVFEKLRRKGHRPVGIRLDSGDLAYLSIQAARMLNAAGFEDTIIVLSSELDELVIWQIITQIQEEAPRYGVDPDALIKRLTFGVGTRLITSWGDPALGGVYKLVAIQEKGEWVPAIKISESRIKTPNPGRKRLWRLYDARGKATADLMGLDDEDIAAMEPIILRHPADGTKWRSLPREGTSWEELHVTVLDEGRLVYDFPPLEELRRRAREDIERLDPGVRRLVNPHVYHVSLTPRLWKMKRDLIRQARGEPETE
ncbi:nicotinate phosphoribosyltransferase [Ardenticatena maritima]|nr:nicotinate phosphoribosyltransferase [Ardenticatena maritima]GAP62523.1 nicotinate phosphoribosyltransferase [Ardenticatena maritima]